MKVIFSKFAKLELDDAMAYYELEYEGLGRKFKEEVRTAIKRIVQHPEAWSIESGDVRKYLVPQVSVQVIVFD